MDVIIHTPWMIGIIMDSSCTSCDMIRWWSTQRWIQYDPNFPPEMDDTWKPHGSRWVKTCQNCVLTHEDQNRWWNGCSFSSEYWFWMFLGIAPMLGEIRTARTASQSMPSTFGSPTNPTRTAPGLAGDAERNALRAGFREQISWGFGCSTSEKHIEITHDVALRAKICYFF